MEVSYCPSEGIVAPAAAVSVIHELLEMELLVVQIKGRT